MYDNRIFNVNGESDSTLLMALTLAFEESEYKCVGWTQSATHGLQLEMGIDTQTNVFPTPLSASECFPLVKQWLSGNFAQMVECEGTDADADHDGHNNRGWRVYVEDANGYCPTHAICRIKPAYIWYGK